MYRRVAIVCHKPSVPVIRYLVRNKIAMANVNGTGYKQLTNISKLHQKLKNTVVVPHVNNFEQLQITRDLGFLHLFTFDFANSYHLNNQKLLFDIIVKDRLSINYTTVDDSQLLKWIETWIDKNN